LFAAHAFDASAVSALVEGKNCETGLVHKRGDVFVTARVFAQAMNKRDGGAGGRRRMFFRIPAIGAERLTVGRFEQKFFGGAAQVFHRRFLLRGMGWGKIVRPEKRETATQQRWAKENEDTEKRGEEQSKRRMRKRQ
jgi:hypothetical protein